MIEIRQSYSNWAGVIKNAFLIGEVVYSSRINMKGSGFVMGKRGDCAWTVARMLLPKRGKSQ